MDDTPSMRERRSRRIAIAIALGAPCWLLAAGQASAADFEVEATTAAQAYEVGSPWGDLILERRRLMQTLALGVYNIQGKYTPGEADFAVVLKLRLDADFGVNAHLVGPDAGGETNFDRGQGTRFVPGYQTAPLDLMYGYVEGRNLGGGWLGFRLGRQYMTDVLGWWSFDGGLVRVTTPFFVQAEVYGGLEQRGGLPLSTSRFERQGIWRGSHAGFGSEAGLPSVADFPSYQYTMMAPAFGAALESNGPSFAHGRFSYRRVYNLGTSVTQQFPDPGGGYRTAKGMRLSQERLGYAADANLPSIGGIKGGFAYDLYNQLVGSAYGGVEVYIGRRVTVGADADYFVPTFDADSIWNWFTHSPVTTLTGRTSIDITEEIDVSASGGVRLWTTDGDPDEFRLGQCGASGIPEAACTEGVLVNPDVIEGYTRNEENRASAASLDALANLAGRYRLRSAEVGLRGMLQTGERGRRVGGDLSGEKRLDGGRYALGTRLSLYNWEDPLRPDRGATSFGYVLGAGWNPGQIVDVKIEWEHDMNRLVGQRFRVVGLVNLRVAR
jgi:hypothetical protein